MTVKLTVQGMLHSECLRTACISDSSALASYALTKQRAYGMLTALFLSYKPHTEYPHATSNAFFALREWTRGFARSDVLPIHVVARINLKGFFQT